MTTLALLGGRPVRSMLLPYTHQTIEPDDLAAVNAALTADWMTQGPLVARFEQALAEYGGVRHAGAMASGPAAPHAACWAAGLGPDGAGITPPLTFAAPATASRYAAHARGDRECDRLPGRADRRCRHRRNGLESGP